MAEKTDYQRECEEPQKACLKAVDETRKLLREHNFTSQVEAMRWLRANYLPIVPPALQTWYNVKLEHEVYKFLVSRRV